MSVVAAGPQFKVESDKAVIVLGNSERLETGNLWAEKLDERKLFAEIDVVTLNKVAAMLGRTSLKQHLQKSTVFTHSGGITRIEKALQIVAINPPEPVAGVRQLVQRAVKIGNDPIKPEVGAHRTGSLDLLQAGFELLRSPASTVATIHKIGRSGYSTVRELSDRRDDFPAGRAIVHSEFDGFGFKESANMIAAAAADISTVTIEGAYHNSILFTPGWILSEMTPAILPAS